jgi:hypothetical protein
MVANVSPTIRTKVEPVSLINTITNCPKAITLLPLMISQKTVFLSLIGLAVSLNES